MRILLLCCVLLLSAFLADSAAPGPPTPFAARWKKIDALLKKDQTATAAPLVESIYQQAKKENNASAYVRALLYKIRLLNAKQQDADEKAIALLEADVQTAQFPARPILHSLLAGLYANYYNQHRYQLYERTAGAAPTAATPTSDADGGTTLATWDAARLGAAIVRHYYQSVEDDSQRQLKTTLAQLGDLAIGGDAEGRQLRPTLYDLLAQRAIAGLQNQELYITKPEQQFELTDPKLFGSAQEFAALKLTAPAPDSLNGQLHALRLLQRLTTARLAANNPAALADVDLQRLDYLHNQVQGTDLAAQYDPALTRLAETYKALPLSTEFIARRAEARRETDAVAAVALAREAEARFPKSRGAARALALRQQIERPEVSFSAADIVVPGQPWRLDVTARNVTELHAWAYRISQKQKEAFDRYESYNQPADERYAAALKNAPVATWVVPVPKQALDYKERKLSAAGVALPAGSYLVVVSNQAKAPLLVGPTTATSYTALGASELSIVNRNRPDTNAPELLVLQRQSGQPLAGVSAQVTYQRYDQASRQQVMRKSEVQQTAASGMVELPTGTKATDKRQQDEQVAQAQVWRGSDTLVVSNINGYYYGNRQRDDSETKCFLFTDRAIYRPGQTVYFKGILLEREGGKTQLLAKEEQEVELEDANNDTVQKLTFTTNEFGSFHGSFVLPTGRLNGEFKLTADDGELRFSVEDYKRPTFYVQLDSVPGRPQLGQPLTVGGRARAYAGQATDGATVNYHVTRRELWPLFDYGFRRRIYQPGSRGSNQEIAHGTATTDTEGRFNITFTPPLVPKVRGRQGWEPGYVFEVTADVTDAAGETRTDTRGYPVGRNPLSLRLTGSPEADKQRLPPLLVQGISATYEAVPAVGTLRLLALRYRPNAAGIPGPLLETEENEAKPELVKTLPFDTKQSTRLDVAALLSNVPTGRYRLEALATGPDSARAKLDFTLYDSKATTIPFATPDWFVTPADSVLPGQPATVLVGSSEADARVLLEVERGGQLLRQEWLTLKANEQRRLSIESGPIAAVGPLYIHTTQVRDNHLYRHDATVQVADKPQALRLEVSTFRDRLQPGQKETWRVTIHQASGKPADAELLATLYDQSLDVFKQHSFQPLVMDGDEYPARYAWAGYFGAVRAEQLLSRNPVTNTKITAYPILNTQYAGGELLAEFTRALGPNWQNAPAPAFSQALQGRAAGVQVRIRGVSSLADGASDKQLNEMVVVGYGTQRRSNLTAAVSTVTTNSARAVDLSSVKTRTDFRETAFWQPDLRTDKNGDIVLEFQMPEAVTRWQLLALAHDKQLHTGQLARQLVTQKEIQITPNAPRFLRQGDTFTFPAKFSNLTDQATSGTAQLFLLDAATGQDITSQLLHGQAQQTVSAAAHQSIALGWELSLPPDFAPVAVTYRVVAQTTSKGQSKKRKAKNATTFSDGEENTLPVLPNRILLTESLPLPIVGPATRTFDLTKLTSTSSPTRRNYSLTLEMTANPAWYAVQSLPYLLEYPYECSEQTFSRLYANLVAAQILKANPRFKTVLAEWTRQAQSGTATQRNQLSSKLAQNQELKNLLLQETPWVRDAQGETERLARLSTLFDETRLQSETARTLAKLQQLQGGRGAFPWFEKMPDDRYITQLIVAGFGKLKKLGAFDATQDDTGRGILQNALHYLDEAIAADYAQLRKQKDVKLTDDHLSDLQIQALYARSFWLQQPESAAAKAAYTYYRQQAAAHWPAQTRYLQAQIALSLFRTNQAVPATQDILRALAENALHSPELGMYWKEVRGGYYWREAPTETQATLIEAFDEVKNDQHSVDEMKLWLLKQKQTHSWESTRATADACYALLLRGSDWLAAPQPLQVTVGGQKIQPEATQAGTGYFKTNWTAAEIKPAQGNVTVTKPDAGVAWGALNWQYFEDIDKVTPAATPLSLERQLYRETRTANGPTLEKISLTTPLRVGDALVVRLVLRTDRELEYVHLKDQRAAGLEPTQQTSSYRYQNGLGYYESPRDAATNFFLSVVPRGTHIFEYRLRASQNGDFSGGLSQVQCLYAPEFGAHSAGQRLRIASH
jgi:hypothetical protein